MDIREIRRIRLKEEVEKFEKVAEFARTYNLDPTYISQLLNRHRNIGEKSARKLELAIGLEPFSLDQRSFFERPHTEQNGQYDNQSKPEPPPPHTNVAPGPRITGRVPLISWVQAGNWTEVADVFQPEDAEDWIISAFNHSDMAYALRVRGISMEPEFREGEIIIVDPTRSADPGKFVVAKKSGTDETTFKQLIQEGSEYYLKALNPDWPEPIMRMNEEWTVAAVVIGKTKAY